jgi:hypothetical protein
MAIRGPKIKTPFVPKLVTGGPGQAAVEETGPEEIDAGYDNELQPPTKLGRRQQELWETLIRKAPWLTEFDVPRAFMWVHLHTQFEKAPSKMVAGKIAQLRALGSELGLDPASRARIAGEQGSRGKADPADKYFRK